jgi:hypothetical protein
MPSRITQHVFRKVGLPAISAMATIMFAAAADPDRNWARLRALPEAERTKLADALKRFDLLYTREQQKALRDLDRRINELDPQKQSDYFAALRRYHNWLSRLPEKQQEELKNTPPEDRLSLVRKIVAKHSVPAMSTARYVQMADLGDYSPLELAAIFKIWQELPADRRAQVERIGPIPKRHQELFKLGAERKLPPEILPPEFDEKHWTTKFETFATNKRPQLLFNDMKKQENVHAAIRRRQAINYYFVLNRPHAVAADRLAQFLAAFPPWLQTAFDPYAPDEAQRRLGIVYRLVFPFPAEMKPASRPAGPVPGARAVASPPGGAPKPTGTGPARPGPSPF